MKMPHALPLRPFVWPGRSLVAEKSSALSLPSLNAAARKSGSRKQHLDYLAQSPDHRSTFPTVVVDNRVGGCGGLTPVHDTAQLDCCLVPAQPDRRSVDIATAERDSWRIPPRSLGSSPVFSRSWRSRSPGRAEAATRGRCLADDAEERAVRLVWALAACSLVPPRGIPVVVVVGLRCRSRRGRNVISDVGPDTRRGGVRKRRRCQSE